MNIINKWINEKVNKLFTFNFYALIKRINCLYVRSLKFLRLLLVIRESLCSQNLLRASIRESLCSRKEKISRIFPFVKVSVHASFFL